MLPAVLKEWGSLKARKAWRRLTGKTVPRPATLADCGSSKTSTALP
jgi:hypothetical protein